MIGLLRIILIIVVAYYLIRILDRYIIPYLFGTKSKQKSTSRDRNKSSFTYRNKDGDITITESEKKEKKFNKKDGEYVDYEEVE